MLGRVVVGLWLAILVAAPAAAQDYDRGMAAYRQGDYATALRNWRPLARRGHAAAQSSLGFMYNYGHGVPQDYAEALKWYRRAARQGYPAAQYHLGYLYTKGYGVPQDYVRAHMWFSLGAEGGLAYSDKNRAILARRMTPEQIAKAEEMVREWRVEAKKRAAGKAAAKRKAAAKAAARRKAAAKAAARRKAAAKAATKGKAVGGTPPVAATPEAPSGPRPAGTASAVKVMAHAGASVPSEARETQAAGGGTAPTMPVQQVKRAADTPTAGKAGSGKGPVVLQLGATKSEAFAAKAVARITKAFKSVLGEVEVKAVRTDLGSRGVYYRLRAGPIADGAAGKEICRKLVARGQSCLLLRH